jgi:hypothetical protein
MMVLKPFYLTIKANDKNDITMRTIEVYRKKIYRSYRYIVFIVVSGHLFPTSTLSI